MKKYKKIIFLTLLIAIFIIPLKSQAQAITLPKFLPDCINCDPNVDKNCIECGFNDFVQLLINAYNYGLVLLGLIVLFFFVWGGFGFILAAGRQEKIQNSKKIITGAFIGMLIILTSWLTVDFLVSSFLKEEISQSWWSLESCHEKTNEVCEKNELKLGCGGEEGSETDKYVRELQTALNKLGCDCGTVDGCFGPQTEKCVINFQLSSLIMNPNGVVEEETWFVLNSGEGSCSTAIEEGEGDVESPQCCIPKENASLPENLEDKCLNCQYVPQENLQYYDVYEGTCDEGDNASLCGIGCCLPRYDLYKDCYPTQGTACEGTDLYFAQSCDSLDSFCLWRICVYGINTCKVTRGSCGDADTGFTYETSEEATEKMNTIPECNYGTCAVENEELVEGPGEDWRICSWVSKNDCETMGGDFFYNIQPEIVTSGATTVYKIPDTNIYCAGY